MTFLDTEHIVSEAEVHVLLFASYFFDWWLFGMDVDAKVAVLLDQASLNYN